MRILGIDYGDKRIGVAVSDPLGITAQGVAVIGRGGATDDDLRELKKIVRQFEGIDEIVVGLPKTLSGKIGPQAEKTLAFIEVLKQAYKLNIVAWDERLTTVAVERVMIEAGLSRQKRRKVIDKSAAALILQSYLDSKNR